MIDSFSQNSQHRRCCLPVSAHSPHFRHPPRTQLSDYKRNVSSDFAIRPEGLQIYLRPDPRHRYATFMPKSPHANWFAAQLKPNGLKRAEENLTRQGFETFCPKRLEGRLQGGQYRPRERPLFPGYLFVSSESGAQDWAAINATRGVSRLLLGNLRAPAPCQSIS